MKSKVRNERDGMAARLYHLFREVAEVFHLIRLEQAIACVFQLPLTPHIVRRAAQ